MKNWFQRMRESSQRRTERMKGYYWTQQEKKRLQQMHGTSSSFGTSQIPSSTLTATRVGSKATIKRVWVDVDVQQNKQRGMVIHTAFNYTKSFLFSASKGEEKGQVTVHFGHAGGLSKKGLLKSSNAAYRDGAGNVCVWRNFGTKFLSTFSDFALFMPYDELHLPPGQHRLSVWVSVWRIDNKRLAIHKPIVVTLNNPA